METLLYASVNGIAILENAEWELTGSWAYFENSKTIGIELRYIGKRRWYQKPIANQWVDEVYVNFIHWNQKEEDKKDD